MSGRSSTAALLRISTGGMLIFVVHRPYFIRFRLPPPRVCIQYTYCISISPSNGRLTPSLPLSAADCSLSALPDGFNGLSPPPAEPPPPTVLSLPSATALVSGTWEIRRRAAAARPHNREDSDRQPRRDCLQGHEDREATRAADCRCLQ